MRHHHGGSGRAVVIPEDWSDVHSAVAAGTMVFATINLRRPGGTGQHFDQALGHTVSTPYAPFATGVPARVQALTETSVPAQDAAVDQVRVLGYRLSVPRDTAVSDVQLDEGVIVDVATCTGDSMLVGATLTVTDIVRGSHRFERDLIADLNT